MKPMIAHAVRRRAGTRWMRVAVTGTLAVAALSAAVLASAAPAAAAVPDRIGFVLWSGSAVVPSGTTPAATTVVALGVGRYRVTFPGLATTNGIVHVTAIKSTPHWCQAESWGSVGPDETVTLRCYLAGGVLDPSGFAAFFTRSSGTGAGGPYGYVDAQPSGAIVSQYNSAGAGNVVTPLAVGQWKVKLPGLGTPGPNDGSWQATAVNAASPARCKIASWSSTPADQSANVFCFNSAGAAFNTRFTVSFQYRTSLYGAAIPPKYFGYLWNIPPLGPPTTNFNAVLGVGFNTISSAGVGLSLVQFPAIGFTPDTMQVTAYGPSSNFCGLNTIWAHSGTTTVVRDVNCFTNAGTAVNTGFLISDNSIL
jgi:hypothetical protein